MWAKTARGVRALACMLNTKAASKLPSNPSIVWLGFQPPTMSSARGSRSSGSTWLQGQPVLTRNSVAPASAAPAMAAFTSRVTARRVSGLSSVLGSTGAEAVYIVKGEQETHQNA